MTQIRAERFGDAAAIRSMTAAAFGRSAEADLVEELRADGDLVLSLVATNPDAAIVGHVAFSRLRIRRTENPAAAAALAPLSVHPTWQRRRIGAALVEDGLRRLAAAGEQLVFVLGEPGYYRRFRFEQADAFTSPYSGPHFLVCKLTAHSASAGEIEYPRAFASLG